MGNIPSATPKQLFKLLEKKGVYFPPRLVSPPTLKLTQVVGKNATGMNFTTQIGDTSPIDKFYW